jgi:hypothetical protein
MSNASNKPFSLTFLRACFWLVAIVLGVLHTWAGASSRSMNPDGIAYLDMGDAYLRGDWDMALNPYWSPLYSWLLAPVIHVFHPSMLWEFPVVHMVNFLIYVLALICFEFFWLRLMRYHQASSAAEESVTLPEWALLALGYTLFIYSALNLIKIWSVTPDMCVAALVYLAAGLIVQVREGAATRYTFAALGIVLGFGYLAKAAMFPLALIFLGITLFSVGNLRRGVPLVLVALTFFLLVAAPLIISLSNAKGRLTFGDAGGLNYSWYANGVPYSHWQGGIPDHGNPKHPTRKIFDAPPIYEFGTPIGGTYPVSYDPSYWYEGVVPHFNWRDQISVLLTTAQFYFDLLFRQQGVLIAGLLILYGIRLPRLGAVINILRSWGLAIVAMAAFGMYSLVYVESRYIGAFVVLFWADLLARVRLPDSPVSRRVITLVSAIMLTFMLVNIAAFNLQGFAKIALGANTGQRSSERTSRPQLAGREVAGVLHGLGVSPGDKVALIGYGFDAYWARLARVKIVAEMLFWEADKFWLGDSSFQSQVIQAFASTGARAIVAENVPTYVHPTGWNRVGNSSYYVYLFGP